MNPAERGLNWNGKNSYSDFGWWIKSFVISPADKSEITQTVPYMDGAYRFTTLNGGPFYSLRNVTITFKRKVPLMVNSALFDAFKNWLFTESEDGFWEDFDYGWIYYGNCVSMTQSQKLHVAEITATFQCDPFKKRRWRTGYIPDEYYDEAIDTEALDYAPPHETWARVQVYNPCPVNVLLSAESIAKPNQTFWGGFTILVPYDQNSDLSGKTQEEGTALGHPDAYSAGSISVPSIRTTDYYYHRQVSVQPGWSYVWLYGIGTEDIAVPIIRLEISEVSL